jgi:hypothetical protein
MLTHYCRSGRFELDAPFAALTAGAVAALALSWLYAYALLYLPLIGTFTLLLTLGLGFGAGAVTAVVLRARRCRSLRVGWAVGALIGLLTLWLSWVTYTVARVDAAAGEASFLSALLHPRALWACIAELNAAGAWSFLGVTPKGGLLWALWGAEAVLIVGVAAATCAASVAQPFCEGCGTWCEERRGVARSADGDEAALREALGKKRFAAVWALGPTVRGSAFYRYDVFECTACGETNTLSVLRIAVNALGARVERRAVVRHLLLSRADVAALDSLAARRAGRSWLTSGTRAA